MLTANDIQFSPKGFYIAAIKNASDKKLSKLEDILSEQLFPVEWANIDDLGYLSVSWRQSHFLTHTQEEQVCKIINSIFKTRKQ